MRTFRVTHSETRQLLLETDDWVEAHHYAMTHRPRSPREYLAVEGVHPTHVWADQPPLQPVPIPPITFEPDGTVVTAHRCDRCNGSARVSVTCWLGCEHAQCATCAVYTGRERDE